MVDIKLVTFLKVIECGSYTAAAKVLHLTQPAITQHIQKLEEELNCRVFQAQGRTLSLTEAGKIVMQHAHIQLAMQRQLQARLENIIQPLSLGITLSIADYYMPKNLLKSLSEGGYNCSIQVGNTEVLLNQLIQGTLDCALIEGLFEPELFVFHQYCNARFVGAVRHDHPLAHKTLSLKECLTYPLILREQGSGTRAILENFLKGQNLDFASFPHQFELGSFSLIKQLVNETEGITFVYEKVIEKEIQEGTMVILDIEEFQVERPLTFVYLKDSAQCDKYEQFFAKFNM